jgi:hypothetical protein
MPLVDRPLPIRVGADGRLQPLGQIDQQRRRVCDDDAIAGEEQGALRLLGPVELAAGSGGTAWTASR